MAVIRIIQKHLEKVPGDAWAEYQIVLILNLANIERGGPFGNSNINHYAALFTDISERVENKSRKTQKKENLKKK